MNQTLKLRNIPIVKTGANSFGFTIPKAFFDNASISTDAIVDAELTIVGSQEPES